MCGEVYVQVQNTEAHALTEHPIHKESRVLLHFLGPQQVDNEGGDAFIKRAGGRKNAQQHGNLNKAIRHSGLCFFCCIYVFLLLGAHPQERCCCSEAQSVTTTPPASVVRRTRPLYMAP